MNKHILIAGILIGAIAMFTTCEQSEVQPVTSDGNFRLIRIETIDDLTNETPMYIHSFEYLNQLLDQTYDYSTDGDTVSYTKYFYNNDLLSHTEKYVKKINGNFDLSIRKEYSYSNNWLNQELLIYEVGSEKIDYEFSNGQLTSKLYYDTQDNLAHRENFFYNNNTLIRVDEKGQDGSLTRYRIYSYPDEFTLKETVYAPDDEVIRVISTSYNQNGYISFVKSDEIALWSSRSDNLKKYVYEKL